MRGGGLGAEAPGAQPLPERVHRLLQHGQRQVQLHFLRAAVLCGLCGGLGVWGLGVGAWLGMGMIRLPPASIEVQKLAIAGGGPLLGQVCVDVPQGLLADSTRRVKVRSLPRPVQFPDAFDALAGAALGPWDRGGTTASTECRNFVAG